MCLVSVVTAIYVTLLILEIMDEPSDHARYVTALIPGIVLGICEGLWRRKGNKPFWLTISFFICGLCFFFFLAKDGFSQSWLAMRFAGMVAVAHLLLAASVRWYQSSNEKFWSENIYILLRFLAATLLTALLTGSVILVLYLIDYLFVPGHFVDEKFIGVTATWAILVYHPLYFVKGFLEPNREEIINNKVFFSAISYIFTPLMWIYILIMFAYFIKIGFQGQWPAGGVSYWIAALSVLGTLLYLLGFQYFKTKTTQLNTWYYKFFFILTIPVLLLLFAAIYSRISAYGWTENRYYAVGLGVWLLGISLYFILSKSKSLYLIPLTLAITLFLGAIGPWSANHVTNASQHKELSLLLKENRMLDETGFHKSPNQLDQKIENRILDVSGFLGDRDEMSSFINTHDPVKSEELPDEKYAILEQFNSTIGISAGRNDNNNRYIQIKSSTAIRNFDASKFDHIWFYEEHQEGFNEFPHPNIKDHLIDSIADIAKNIVQPADYKPYELDKCIQGATEEIEYEFCCVACDVMVSKDRVEVNRLMGMFYYRTHLTQEN